MNKKQKFCMWGGIVVFIIPIIVFGPWLMIFFVGPMQDADEYFKIALYTFCLWVFFVAVVTGGLIVKFKDKQQDRGITNAGK